MRIFKLVIALLIVSLLAAPITCVATTETENKKSNIALENSIAQMLPSGEENDKITVNGGDISITREMAGNLNNDMEVRGARMDSIAIFKELFKDPRVDSVQVTSIASFVDKYGQTFEDAGAIYTMSRETYQKINWDNFLTDNLDSVADYVYIHPAYLR